MTPQLSFDVGRDVSQLFDYAFMINALWAGTLAAVMAGLVGWFMVLRRQSFAGHTLSVMAFPGAAGAALAGVPLAIGYYVMCAAAALAMAPAQRRDARAHSTESAATGLVQATGLGVGYLLLSLYHGVLGSLETLLFGSFLGIGSGQVRTLAVVCAVVVAALALAGRPLLFASIDPQVARARRVPTAALSIGFLLLLALAVAATSQITGALLVFALLITPAATAQTLSARPAVSLALTVALALVTVWLGLGIAYYSPYPVGFWITTVAFALYVAARLGRATRERLARRAPPALAMAEA